MSEFGHTGIIGRGFSIDVWGAGPFEITINGKKFCFEDSDRFGPAILGRDGNPSDNQPGERSPFWKAHHQWVKGGRRLDPDQKTCIWDEPKPTVVKREMFKGKMRKFVVEHGEDYGETIVLPDEVAP